MPQSPGQLAAIAARRAAEDAAEALRVANRANLDALTTASSSYDATIAGLVARAAHPLENSDNEADQTTAREAFLDALVANDLPFPDDEGPLDTDWTERLAMRMLIIDALIANDADDVAAVDAAADAIIVLAGTDGRPNE